MHSHAVEQRVEWCAGGQLPGCTSFVARRLNPLNPIRRCSAGCTLSTYTATLTSLSSSSSTVGEARPARPPAASPRRRAAALRHLPSPRLTASPPPTPAPAVGQYFLCPLLLRESFFSTVLSNSLYGIAMSYYHYTQFLGYSGAICVVDAQRRRRRRRGASSLGPQVGG